MNILLTGASGFLGCRLTESFFKRLELDLTTATRRKSAFCGTKEIMISGVDADTDWSAALTNQRVVIHAAARAHTMEDELNKENDSYRQVNVEGTLNLASQASRAGVRRFIFISSIGVNGSISRAPFTEDDDPNPFDTYAKSKWEAEQGLWKIQREAGMEIVILRPPLVYGPNAPGNFGRLVRWIERGVPLPFGAVLNQRSLVALDNLVDLITTCIDHPAAANQVFLAGDGEDLSTTELLRAVAKAMGKPSRLVPVPAGILMLGARLVGKKDVAQRLLGSLQVDISKAREVLGWEPPISVEEGLRRCFPERR